MSTTLQQQYQQKRKNDVQNKLKLINERLIESNVDYQVHLLLEALDENEYKQATEVINKLQEINNLAKSADLDLLSGAIETILKEINNFTGGSALDRMGSKISSLFSKAPKKNPILAGLGLVESLEQGFKILPTILKNNIPDIESNKDKQKMKLIDIVKDDDKLKKNIETNLAKGFVPKGTFGKLFGKIPGVDINKLMTDLMNANVSQLNEIAKVLNQGTTVAEIAPELAQPEKAGTGEEGASPGKDKEPKPEQKKQNMVLLQTAAKKAGISDGKALAALIDVLEYEQGSFESTLTIPTLQKLMNAKNIPDDQTDGFIRGLMTDFEADFKNKIKDAVDKELEKRQKEKEKKAGAPGA